MRRGRRWWSWLIASSAPHGFLIYNRLDVHPVMEATGDGADSVAYLMGNLGLPEVSSVGVELDRKLAGLLEALDVDVPEALLQS